MNLIISWGYDTNNAPFKRLLKQLDVKYCATLCVEEPVEPFDSSIEHDEINIYSGYDFYTKDLDKAIPLDAELIDKMSKYQATAMDIIYRWRRSISTKETYKEIKEIYYSYLKFWNDFIINKQIDCLILYNLPHIPSNYIIYALCKVYNIPTIVQILGPSIEGAFRNKYFTDDIDGMDAGFADRYQADKTRYENIDEKDITVSDNFQVYFDQYMNENNKIKRVIVLNEEDSNMRRIRQYVDRARLYIAQERYKILLNKILYYARIKHKSNSILKYYETIEELPDYNEKFVFFPLHFQPEATTLPHAGVYMEQMLVVHMIAKYLPSDVKLYIKEHPAFWQLTDRYECVSEVRSKKYYDEMRKLKNVKIIKHDYSSLELMDRCQCVVTGTGTAGIESIFKFKPVIIFGNMFYSYMPGAFRINSKDECREAITKILSTDRKEITLKDLKVFFKTMEPITVLIGHNEGYADLPGFPSMSMDECGNRMLDGILNFMRIRYPEIKILREE